MRRARGGVCRAGRQRTWPRARARRRATGTAWNARSPAEELIVRLISTAQSRGSGSTEGRPRSRCSWRWRARRRPEDAARDQEHGRGRRGGPACAARRSRPARIANAGSGRHRRRAGPRKGGGGAVDRHGCPTLHRAQASQSPPTRLSACTRKSRTTTADMIYAARAARSRPRRKAFIRKWLPNAAPSPTAWRKPHDRLFTFTRFPPSQWKSIRTRTRSSDVLRRSSSAGSRPQTVLPCAETAAMLFWALLASGQITMRKVDGWQTLAEKPDDQIIDLPHDRIASCRPKTRQSIPT